MGRGDWERLIRNFSLGAWHVGSLGDGCVSLRLVLFL